MTISTKHILHLTGSILAFAGIGFVAFRFCNYATQIDFSTFNTLTWSVMFGLVCIYGLINICLALAWFNILKIFSVETSKIWAIKTYGLSQLAKYVPGNIVHLASRQAIGMAAGIDGWILAKSSIWELGLISAAALLFSILVFPQFILTISIPITITCFISLLLITTLGLSLYKNQTIAQAFAWYIVFLTISGMIFVGLLILIRGSVIPSLQSILFCATFIIAWLIGLITPGAPAGIGIREFMIVFFLKDYIPESDLLLATLLSRMVTVGGDILFFLYSYLFLPNTTVSEI